MVLAIALVFLFYILPGGLLIATSRGNEGKRLENIALAVLLSLIFAPVSLALLGYAFPGNDRALLAGYLIVWGLPLLGLRLFRSRVIRWLPDFKVLPRAGAGALLFSVLLAVLFLALRFNVFQGQISKVADDFAHFAKVTSIAATGLPSLYSRQPLYPFTYYDLDYIVPALVVRFSEGSVGVVVAWLVHASVQTFVVTLFLARILFLFARSWAVRLFGLLTLNLAAGLDYLLAPWLLGLQQIGGGANDVDAQHGLTMISSPILLQVYTPQHMLGLAIVGLIFYLIAARPYRGIPQAVAFALLLVALFRASTFVFAGLLPGLALWYLYELLKTRRRMHLLAFLAVTALLAFALNYPYLVTILQKTESLTFGLRSFSFLDFPSFPWLRFPGTVLLLLFVKFGMLLPMFFWLLTRPYLYTTAARTEEDLPTEPEPVNRTEWKEMRLLYFWVFAAVGLLIPFIVRLPNNNEVAMRGVIPAQVGVTLAGCYVLTLWEKRHRRLVIALVALQVVLTTVVAGIHSNRIISFANESVPASSRWIARNTPFNALVFYEQDPATSIWTKLIEPIYGQRLSYVEWPVFWDWNMTPAQQFAWDCLPKVNLYAADSLCAIEANIPGEQPVYVSYLSPPSSLDAASFAPLHQSTETAIYSLSCPVREFPKYDDPPMWMREPYDRLAAVVSGIPAEHLIVAGNHRLAGWLQQEGFGERPLAVASQQGKRPVDPLSQEGFWLTVAPPQTAATSTAPPYLERQFSSIDAVPSPVWFLLDYTSDPRWNDAIYAHVRENYYVAQPSGGRSEWFTCDQRAILALPSAGRLIAVQKELQFDQALVVNEWLSTDRTFRAGDIVAMALVWRQIEDGQLKFFIHLLDENGTLFSQTDLSLVHDRAVESQHLRLGLYLPPELSAGQYQIRLGVYRPEDGQRLLLPNGADHALIPLTVSDR